MICHCEINLLKIFLNLQTFITVKKNQSTRAYRDIFQEFYLKIIFIFLFLFSGYKGLKILKKLSYFVLFYRMKQ